MAALTERDELLRELHAELRERGVEVHGAPVRERDRARRHREPAAARPMLHCESVIFLEFSPEAFLISWIQ
jgi:hypothetical protein